MSPSAAAALVLDVATLGSLGLEAAAGRLHGALRALRCGKARALDDIGLGHRARQYDLDALGVLRHQIRRNQPLDRDLGRRHAHQIVERELGARCLDGRSESGLRQPPLQRHLSAFESNLVIAALARALSLHAAAAGLALAGGRAASYAQMRALRAGPGLDGIQAHISLSSAS